MDTIKLNSVYSSFSKSDCSWRRHQISVGNGDEPNSCCLDWGQNLPDVRRGLRLGSSTATSDPQQEVTAKWPHYFNLQFCFRYRIIVGDAGVPPSLAVIWRQATWDAVAIRPSTFRKPVTATAAASSRRELYLKFSRPPHFHVKR